MIIRAEDRKQILTPNAGVRVKAARDFLPCRAGGLAPRRALWYACPDKSQMAKER